MGEGGPVRVLVIANRPAVSREVARRLVGAGFYVSVVPTITGAISALVLDPPTFVVFDSHNGAIEGVRSVAVLLRFLEAYGVPAVDFAVGSAADEDGLAGRPAPLRPRPQVPSLRAAAEIPNEANG